jgi:putative MATE family efflux protein
MYPTLLGMVAMVSYNVADTWFIGRLGSAELAAVSFTFPVVLFIGAVTVGLAHGTSSVCARLFGQGDAQDVGRVALHAVLLGVLVGLFFLAAGLATIEPLFRALGADAETLPIIARYMRIYYFGGVFMVVPLIVNPIMRAAGDARTPAVIVSAAALLNVVLDPILIFGLFGAPRLGIEGAAIATVAANAAMMLAAIIVMRVRFRLISFDAWHLAELGNSWRRILHVGLPSIVATVIGPLTVAFITRQVAQFGADAVAGFGVASRIEGLVVLVLMALSVAVAPFVGQNHGARRRERVAAGIAWAQRFSLGYGIVCAALLATAGVAIAAAFTDNDVAISTAALHMRIVPISYAALGVALAATSSFNAVGRPLPGLCVSMMRTILVYAPLAFLLARSFGLTGIFAAAAVANVAAGTLGFALGKRAFA